MKYPIIFILLGCSFLFAQQHTISGSVYDRETGTPLTFANIRVLNTMTGTAANRNGRYEIKLREGKYSLSASYIGYYSDTISLDLKQNTGDVNFYLSPTRIELQEITIRPGENPALGVLRKAIERKRIRNNFITSYEHEAYTKGVIKTDQEIDTRDRSVTLSVGEPDSSDIFITAIIENQSRGYFRKPGDFKEIITARKQSANVPSSINILTGGRFIQNFYDDDISFLGSDLPGPLADNALDYYYYYIDRMDAIDSIPVYRIYLTPDNSSDPGFEGYIYITDSTYNLIKVDLQLNRAANRGGLFDTINVFQQFADYDGVYMPADYRIFAAANIFNLVKIGFELNTMLYDYRINSPISDDIFNKAIVTVVPEADERDTAFWAGIQTIPNTEEEQLAYRRIDSINSIPVSFWDNFSLLSTRVGLNENYSFSGPLSLYHFNSVEGHSIDFGFYAEDLLRERLSSDISFSYGFADKRVKSVFNSEYLFGKYRTGSIRTSVYNKTKILFGESEEYNELTATLLALLSKYEFRDYYYSTGAGIKISDEVLPVLRLSLGYDYSKDMSTGKKTEYSFFARDKFYKDNKRITDAEINSVTAGFRIDFRDYIEDGLYRRRTSQGRSYILFEGDVTVSDNSYLHTTYNFTRFSSEIRGSLRSFRSTDVSYILSGIYSMGRTPYQRLYALPGNINLTAADNSFRTLNVNEVTGDRVVTAFIGYNFRDEIFRMLRIPWLKDSEIQLSLFLNSAVSYVSDGSLSMMEYPVREFRHPFYETGFSIGHVLFPLSFDFAWKLNYRDGNNFRFGINTFIYSE